MKQEVLLGIDTIEVVIDTQTILNKNNITFYSSNGNEVGKLVHRQGKKKGYNLILNLPRCVRQNNIQPFSVLDADKIYEITTIVVKQLKKHFGEQLPDLTVKSAEVGATMEIANKKNVQPILNMITGMLLQDKENIVYIACRGKKVGQRYNKVQTLASGINVESIKLPQNSSGRFASKYYDKGLEKDIADEHGIIRVEHIYNKRRVGNWCKNPSRQESIALQKLYALPQYQKLFTAHQKEVIVANGRNPEEVAHEQAVQPVLQEKNSQLAKTYLNGFGLRNIQAQMSNKLTALEKDGEN